MKNREIVVVTGGSAGLGRAIATAFAREGADVAILARGRERLDQAKAELESFGGRALAIPADIADPDQVEAAAEQVERELGPIDIWVNNAMATIFSPFQEIRPEEFRRATEVTYLGFVWGTQAALRRMTPRNRGAIVQVGSALAYRSIPLQSAYCGAKHAIKGFTESIRSELIHARSRVHLTMVQMPALNTPQFSWGRTRMGKHPQPVGPIFNPEVGARAVVWAAHHRRRQVWVGLPTVLAIVAEKIAPGFLDRYLSAKAWDGQQTEEPIPPGRPDNLFTPAPGDWAARGEFGDRSRSGSLELEFSLNRGWWIAGGLALLAAALGLSWMGRGGSRRLR
jgi:NAD(P)-dependent dehydrogenase (short-subunit alcohol dehydrogenase family)